jgi:large subunit ribosomal protein L23
MKLSDVLIKPILSEKANSQQDKLRRYAFRVAKKANKLEIKKAVENFYGVTVIDVNTVVAPAKSKTRFTKAGFISGQKPSFKKAFVTVAVGETIDLYSNI